MTTCTVVSNHKTPKAVTLSGRYCWPDIAVLQMFLCSSGSSAGRAGHSVLLRSFRSVFLFFAASSPISLGLSSPQYSPVTCGFMQPGQKCGSLAFKKTLATQNIKISARFPTTSWLDGEYLRKAARYKLFLLFSIRQIPLLQVTSMFKQWLFT